MGNRRPSLARGMWASAMLLTSPAGYHPSHPVTRLAQIAGLHTDSRLALGKRGSNTHPSYLESPRGVEQG